MRIHAKAAVQGNLRPASPRRLGRPWAHPMKDASGRITRALEVPEHSGYRFLSRSPKDWWSARYRSHHVPRRER